MSVLNVAGILLQCHLATNSPFIVFFSGIFLISGIVRLLIDKGENSAQIKVDAFRWVCPSFNHD